MLIFLICCKSCIQDNSSENKEENLTNACYDQATYHVKGMVFMLCKLVILITHIIGEEVQIETPFLITTNLESRSERAGDREDLILFEIPTAAPDVMIDAEKKV